jgi:type I restriction-modification system DNA methylase subunit
MYFVYQGSKKINSAGYLGMILPDVILYQSDNELLRRYLLKNFNLEIILNIGDVFHKVTRPSCIIIAKKGKPVGNKVKVSNLTSLTKELKPDAMRDKSRFGELPQEELIKIPGTAFITDKPEHYLIWNKIQVMP